MMQRSNAHVHTTWCDGANTARCMAQRAAELGFVGLGFSGHSPAAFDPECPGILDEEAYRREIKQLRQEYAGRLSILCGTEQDFDAPVRREDYDYIIGSVHYLVNNAGGLVAVDGAPEKLFELRRSMFHDSGLELARSFYEKSVRNVEVYRPDIVGHFDLIVKNNQNGGLFDEQSEAYRKLALEAMDAVVSVTKLYGGIVELNTGGMARGYRDEPYPAMFLLRRMAQRGARVMVNGDSHSADTLDSGYDMAYAILEQAGFDSVAVLKDNGFVDVKL